MAGQVTYRRVYEETSPQDGRRVLVDRVWPRGMRKEDAHLDAWLRDVAPRANCASGTVTSPVASSSSAAGT